MKKIKYFILPLVFLLLAGGCKKEQSLDTLSDNISDGNVISDKNNIVDTTDNPEIIHFVDALGEWHDVDLNESWTKHNYDWTKLTNDGINVSYDDQNKYEILKGVDVSKHQGDIDWSKVKSDGYDFAIIRIAFRGYGEAGKLMIDEKFTDNLKGAKEAGLAVGVYIFSQAINEEEAVEEAQLVIDTLNGQKLDLPVVFDPETIIDDEARTDTVTGEQFTSNALAFFEKIKEAGYKPMIYSNMMWESYMLDLSKLSGIPVWYADYEKEPQTPYEFEFWQYSEKGTVNGITGICDLNVWFKTIR